MDLGKRVSVVRSNFFSVRYEVGKAKGVAARGCVERYVANTLLI